jgi:hypothetical protein
MPETDAIPPDLVQAAQSLEDRMQEDEVIRQARSKPWKTSPAAWNALSERARRGVPPWLPGLLNRFCFCGVTFRLPHFAPETGYPFLIFGFFDPSCYEEDWMSDLTAFGFYSFAAEENGDLWVAKAEEGPGHIYLLESSAWDGSQPTLENGLLDTKTSLSALLAGFSVWHVSDGNP